MRNSFIGSPVERLEDLRFLRGRGQYVDDVPATNALHAAILRSSVPHGRIRAIDTTAALKRQGVRAVITAADIGEIPVITMRQELLPEFKPFQQPIIAHGKVRYVGEPVAVVVADSAALAEDALEHVVLDIEALLPVASREASRSNATALFEGNSNLVITLKAERGDAEAAFRDAAYVRRERFEVQRFTAMTMETRGLLAEWDEARGHLTVTGMTKVVFHNRRMLAQQMGLAEDAITMIEADVGGGFGVRGEFYPEDFLVPFAARKLNRPVRWVEDRREHLIASNHARDAECELEIACDRDGTIRGLRGRGAVDLGAYIRTNGVTAARNTAQVLSGPYRVPNIRFENTLLLTNKTPSGTYRGPGRFEADFFRERLFDMAANDLGIDRVEFRRRNLLRESEMPWTLPTVEPLDQGTATDSGDYAMTLDRCLHDFGWAEKQKLQGQLIDGRRHGIAVGCYLEGGGSGPRENVRMVLEGDGTVSLYVGSSSVGQGVETVFAQIAADALDMPMERINRVQHGSTTHVKQGYGSYSSRSIVMGGSAIVQAAENFKIAVRAAAGKRLQCAPDAVVIDGDQAVGPNRASVPLTALAADGIEAEGTHASNKRTYSYGAHAAHVAVDPSTGHVALVDYMAVEDVGRIINPLTLHGQTVGAIVQGLGGALMENLAYDADGQFLAGTLADYLLPTASDFPTIRAHALEEKPAPHNPLGAKGAGEGGIIPVGGVIANAVANALGAEPRALPLSPPRVWELARRAEFPYDPAEMIEYHGRDHFSRVTKFNGAHYYVKQGHKPDEAGKAMLGYRLVAGFMNVPEVIIPDAELTARVLAATNLPITRSPVGEWRLHLVRICQSYSLSMLPIQDLTQAVAAEIVFSTWTNRRDAHNSNRVFVDGVPMFFDFGAAFEKSEAGTQTDFFRKGRNSGYTGDWKLWEIPRDRTLRTREVRDLERHKSITLHPVHDAARFWRHVDEYRRIIGNITNWRIRRVAAASIPDEREATALADLLIEERRRLGTKLERVRSIMTSV